MWLENELRLRQWNECFVRSCSALNASHRSTVLRFIDFSFCQRTAARTSNRCFFSLSLFRSSASVLRIRFSHALHDASISSMHSIWVNWKGNRVCAVPCTCLLPLSSSSVARMNLCVHFHRIEAMVVCLRSIFWNYYFIEFGGIADDMKFIWNAINKRQTQTDIP